MTKIPSRFIWAAGLLDIKPANKILEIGCGAGLLAEQIANKLRTGSLTAKLGATIRAQDIIELRNPTPRR